MKESTVIRISLDIAVFLFLLFMFFALFAPGYIKSKGKKTEAYVKSNCHTIQIAVERYAEDHGEYPEFLLGGDKNYDLIQLALLDAFNASASGLYALSESYLYTTEAIQLYFQRLAADGYLVITRWIKIPPRDTLKLFVTAIDALKKNRHQST